MGMISQDLQFRIWDIPRFIWGGFLENGFIVHLVIVDVLAVELTRVIKYDTNVKTYMLFAAL